MITLLHNTLTHTRKTYLQDIQLLLFYIFRIYQLMIQFAMSHYMNLLILMKRSIVKSFVWLFLSCAFVGNNCALGCMSDVGEFNKTHEEKEPAQGESKEETSGVLSTSKKKIKKSSAETLLRLVRNPDILKTVCAKRSRGIFAKDLKLVGFAAETGLPVEEGLRKCREKGLEFIVANDVTKPGCGFATTTNEAYIIKNDGFIFKTPLMTKDRLAKIILDFAT